MQLTITVKLHPTAQQFTLLLETVTTCNAACERISEIAFFEQNFRQYDLHARVYYAVRGQFHLPAQHAVRCLSKVADAYKLDRKVQRKFRPLGAIELDTRLLTWSVDVQTVSLRTLTSRVTLPFLCSASQKELLHGKKGQTDLQVRDGTFYLCVAVTVEETAPFLPSGCLGINLGIVNVALATDSEGNRYTGEPIKKVRRKYRRLHQLLHGVKTRSARKHLQKARRKESRFVKDVNHGIAKQLVLLATKRQKALSLETLTGIRGRSNGLKRATRTELNTWAFLQLKLFLTYKARRGGVPLVEVDAAYSSQECSRCHYISRENRKRQDSFCCVCCVLPATPGGRPA